MRKSFSLLFLTVLLVSQIAVFQFVPTVNANPNWLTGWTYRKSHVINYATGAGTGYQVRIVAHYGSGTDSGGDVYLNSHCRTDFGDIRFTDDDGTTLLDCWMESKVDAIPPVTNVLSNSWMPTNKPTAVYYNGKTYLVYIDGATVDSYIVCYTHATHTWSDPVFIGTGISDGHGSPCMVINNAGYIYVFYGCHDSAVKWAKSTNPEDISAWTDLGNFATGTCTYPNAIKDSSGNLYVFYRKPSNYAEVYKKSTDGGATWSAESTIITFKNDSNGWCYIEHPAYDAVNGRIHIVWFRGASTVPVRLHVYHAYFKISDGHMYSMNGTDLGTTIDYAEMNTYCKIVDSGLKSTSDRGRVRLDSNGYPYIIYHQGQTDNTPLDGTYDIKFIKWNGSSWTSPQTITTGDFDAELDFILASPTDITLFIAKPDYSLERWTYDGTNWTKASTISTFSRHRVTVPDDFNSELKLFFLGYDGTYYNIYAHDGTNYLWKESSYAVFWVEVADDLSSQNQTIYVYYGKADAATTSNGVNTFLVFEHFDGSEVPPTGWTLTLIGTQQFSEDQANSHFRLYDFTSTSAAWTGRYLEKSITEITSGFRAKAKMSTNVNLGTSAQGIVGLELYSGTTLNYRIEFTDVWTGFTGAKYSQITGTNLNQGQGSTNGAVDLIVEIEKSGATGTAKTYYGGAVYQTKTDVSATFDKIRFDLRGAAHITNQEAKVDYIYIRKFIDPEPSHGSWGSEETGGVAYTVNLTETVTTAWNVLIKRNVIADFSQTITTSWSLVLSHGMFVNLPQTISASWAVLTQWNAIASLSQSLSTVWNVLTQWTSNVGLTQSLSTAWTILTQTSYNAIMSLSNTFVWTVDVLKYVGQLYTVDLSITIVTSWIVNTIHTQIDWSMVAIGLAMVALIIAAAAIALR
jgi:hypothetical protein